MNITKRTYQIRSLMIAVTAVVGSLMSCSDGGSDGFSPELPGDLSCVEAGFYITVGDVINSGDTASRASSVPDGDYDAGSGYENYIDIKGGDFRIMFFKTDDTFVGEFRPTDITPVSGTDHSKRYYVSGELDARGVSGQPFKVMVLANWGEYPEPTVGQTLSSILDSASPTNTFSFGQAQTVPSETSPIPYFGIKLVDDVVFTPEVSTYIGTVHLLRAYAKVTVECVSPEWVLTNVRLTSYNTTGLKAPVGVNDESGYVKGNYDSDYTDQISLPASVSSAANLNFVKTGRNEYTVYVPEYRNATAAGSALSSASRIYLNFEGCMDIYNPTKLRDFYLDFKNYAGAEQGKYFDIKRNYWYRYEVSKASENYQLNVELDVIPFTSVDLRPSFGLERDDISGYIVVRDSLTGKILYWRDNQGNKWYIYMDGKYHYVFSYEDQELSLLDHWFDYTGLKHELTPEGVSRYTAVYDQVDKNKLLYWETPDGHKVWLVMNKYFSVFVYNYVEGGINPSGAPMYWFDFRGDRHSMDEDEDDVIKEWKDILSGNPLGL